MVNSFRLNDAPEMRNEAEINVKRLELSDYELFNHPALELFEPRSFDSNPLSGRSASQSSNKLYLIPTSHGENYEADFAPTPSNLSELPNVTRWTLTYLITALEILAARRPASQVARTTHRYTYNSLIAQVGSLKEVPKIKSIRRSQPIPGVVELSATLIFKERIRALVARFEGVDHKWLCTEYCIHHRGK
ncbi:MAG: hypothetical protein EBV67_02100 [Actinobacteria bacterium]|nr:hypothetical protein [Actinomycetota bacterium]